MTAIAATQEQMKTRYVIRQPRRAAGRRGSFALGSISQSGEFDDLPAAQEEFSRVEKGCIRRIVYRGDRGFVANVETIQTKGGFIG